MARRSEAKTRLIVGIFVMVLSVLLFVSLFIIGQSEGTWETKTIIRTDFRTITGLRKGSPVQLAGVEIGTVSSIDFVNVEYECDPATEDLGRYGEGRTDNCDAFLFCGPGGLCADLEPYASKGQHAPCLEDSDCTAEEICVTSDFRRRARRVAWVGPDGVCARYFTTHRRVQVQMTIFEDKLELVRTDSRATVASNGVLGDQLVNITPGMREPLPEERRIQSSPSLYEDIQLFRDRFDGLTEKVDTSLSGISSLFSQLNDERTINSVKGTLENVEEITRQMAAGEGLVGALLNDEEYKEEFGITLRSMRNTAVGIDRFVDRANDSMAKLDDSFQPMVDDARETMANLRRLLSDLKDPKNKSLAAKLLYDDDGTMAKDLEKILKDVDELAKSANNVVQKVDRGEGTIGKLVNDSKAHDDLVKILRNIERNDTFKRLVRHVIEQEEATGGEAGASDAEAPQGQ
ncbi:MlaD family protein [Paraliomyxa miuraensis]|uniref:MlaD family protein n=1 Tax=Paraliomyxa miuraensis TaxID=376150 RepID=UPI0022534F6E|nr:MlaD family protein [Paraliomyxa miuraensis]MCX4244689.1 MlaD family protein [Paraliomyxa miuraensis]